MSLAPEIGRRHSEVTRRPGLTLVPSPKLDGIDPAAVSRGLYAKLNSLFTLGDVRAHHRLRGGFEIRTSPISPDNTTVLDGALHEVTAGDDRRAGFTVLFDSSRREPIVFAYDPTRRDNPLEPNRPETGAFAEQVIEDCVNANKVDLTKR